MADLRIVLRTQGLRRLVIPPLAGEEKTLTILPAGGGSSVASLGCGKTQTRGRGDGQGESRQSGRGKGQ